MRLVKKLSLQLRIMKAALQQGEGFGYRAARGEGAEIPALGRFRAAMFRQTGKVVGVYPPKP